MTVPDEGKWLNLCYKMALNKRTKIMRSLQKNHRLDLGLNPDCLLNSQPS